MKIRRFLVWATGILLLLTLLPGTAFGLTKPSQAGSYVLSGGQRDFKWPVPGAYNLSSCFLDNRRHYAIDIAADKGTSVVASYDGTVEAVYNGCKHNYGKEHNCCDSGFGNYVILKHSYRLKNGTYTTLYSQYAHLTKGTVSVGQKVSKGDKIGTIGSTGYSTGFHLDYQILKGGYRPFRDYSIDPYVNDLLELPSQLYTSFGSCCKKYVSYVKEYYNRCSHDSYNSKGKCTDCGFSYDYKSTKSIAAMGTYTLSQDYTPTTIPYTGAATQGQALPSGTTVQVQGSYTNGNGESWYAVSVAGGTGYIPKGKLTFVAYLDSQYSGSITAPAQGQTIQQKSHTLKGSISSRYPLRTVSGYIDGKYYAGWSSNGSTTQLNLANTNINKKLYFSTLAPGMHTIKITATDSTARGETTVIESVFYIQPPPTVRTVTCLWGEENTVAYVQDGHAVGPLPQPEQPGHTFLGWFTEAEGGTQVLEDTPITQNITLYPHWERLSYTVTIGDTQQTLFYGETIPQFPQISRTGYALLGWFTAPDSGTLYTAETPVTQDVSLYPHWMQQVYRITLDPGEGSLFFNTRSIAFDTPYGTLPTPTRSGYTFAGWFLDGKPITPDTYLTTPGNHTLTAAWEAVASPKKATDLSVYLWIALGGIVLLSLGYIGFAYYLNKKHLASMTPQEEAPAETPAEAPVEEPQEAPADTPAETPTEESTEEPGEHPQEEPIPATAE